MGRVQRVGHAVDYLSVSALHIQNLQIAPDIISVWDKLIFHRSGDSHVTESGPLNHVVIMRADEYSDIHVVAQRDVGDLLGDKRLTKASDRHHICLAFPLQLNYIRGSHLGFDLLRNSSPGSSELKRSEAVTVDDRTDLGRVCLQAGTNDPTDLPECFEALANE